MSKTKIMRFYEDSIAVIMRRERIPVTVTYDTVKSTPSSMYDPYTHVLEYKSY